MAEVLSALTGRRFVSALDERVALVSHDALVGLYGALRQLAVACMKVANDVRWLASGLR